jgi:NitT/TauT family transport system ATP-binding protein
MDPEVLLMDEPFAALDAQTRAHMHQLLQSIWMRTRKTVVFVTHNVRESLVLADRVVVMAGRPGRILQDLEVHLPRPRDPDDEVLVQYSRQIREAMSTAEAATERLGSDTGARGEVGDGTGEKLPPAGRVPGGPAAGLGADI